MLEYTTRIETGIKLAICLSGLWVDKFAVWPSTSFAELAQLLLRVSKHAFWIGAVGEIFAVLFCMIGDLLSWRWMTAGTFEILTRCGEFADITGIDWCSVFSCGRLMGIGTVLLCAVLIEPANSLPWWLLLRALYLHGRGHIFVIGGSSTIREDTIFRM